MLVCIHFLCLFFIDQLFFTLRFCASCMAENPSRMVTLKPAPTRKSSRKSSTRAVRVPTTDAGGDTPMLDAGAPATTSTIPSSVPTTPSVPAPPISVPRSDLTPAATTMPPDLNKWITVAQSKPYKPDTFRRMKGYEVGQEWIYADPRAMTEPVVIEAPDGLGMKMPPKEYTIRDVAADVGPDTPLEVIGEPLEYSFIRLEFIYFQPLKTF